MTLRAWGLVIVLLAAMTSKASAQGGRRPLTPPVVTSVFPPGATLGTTVDWTLNGRGFSKVKQLFISGQGIELINFLVTNDIQATATVKIDPKAAEGYRELRLEGPDGVSNLVLARIDSMPQVVEVEPNDDPTTAQTIEVNSAVAGVLKSTDIDHFRVVGSPGQEITADFEARRLGTSITPVMTVLNSSGVAIAQSRESRSRDHDCRMSAKFPADGILIIQVRENTYLGNDSAVYRLRVTTRPFATALFPLGGLKGKPLTATVSGGSLKSPIAKTVLLPDESGKQFDPGPFESPHGPVESVGTILVGEDNEIQETVTKGQVTKIKIGEIANGRIESRNEVDKYAVTVPKGRKLHIAIQAEPLGSWLDSVLFIRNSKGVLIADNDDFGMNSNGGNSLNVSVGSIDSGVDVQSEVDDTLTIEVTDRYGDGGPEYGYRLSVGTNRPDFAIKLSLPNANNNMNQAAFAANNRSRQGVTNQFGVYNASPGTKIPVSFTVTPEGRPGPVTVRVEGLPDGVTADPVKVDLLGPGDKGGQPTTVNAASRTDNITLNVASYAYPGVSELRFIGTAEPTPGRLVTRVATAEIGMEVVTLSVPARPITHTIDRFPIRVTGEYRPKLVGPPEEPKLENIRVPEVLLAGDRIDLGLDFDTSPLADPDFKFEARAQGIGLATNTVVLSGMSLPDSEDETPGDVLVRVLASPKVVPGVYPVTISYSLSRGKAIKREISVIVRPPIEVLNRRETLTMKPGGSGSIWVGVRRHPAASVEVELKVEGLPRGVKLKRSITLAETETEAVLELEMAANARPITKPVDVRIVAVARMPRGSVSVESQNRPMIVGELVEVKGRARIE